MDYTKEPGKVVSFIEHWLASKVNKAGADGVVLGLSGGIDSSVLAVLAKRVFDGNMMAVIMPCHSVPEDARDAALVAGLFGIPYRTVDLSSAFDVISESIRSAVTPSDMACANLKARLRMSTLYAIAQSMSYLVCGGSNRSEREVGYFTKFGDSASDLLPIGGLLKCEIRAVASWLGIPEVIISKPPAAGLWLGQTDEQEMGFGYDELDRYLSRGEAEPGVCERIERMRIFSAHKRASVPVCEIKDI